MFSTCSETRITFENTLFIASRSSAGEIGDICPEFFHSDWLLYEKYQYTFYHFTLIHVRNARGQVWRRRGPRSLAYYCHPQAVSERIELFGLWAVVFCCWENSCCTFSCHQTSVQQWCQCMWHISEHLCSQKMLSIILIALTAHHTPSIIRSGTSWMNMEFSGNRNLLFREFPCPLKWKQASSLKITCVRSHSPA